MRRVLRGFGLCLLLSSPIALNAGAPIWAKGAVSFGTFCDAKDRKLCKSVRVPSPDGKNVIEIRYRAAKDTRLAYLHVTQSNGATHDVEAPGDTTDEILWAPDSRAFFVNGGENAYSGFFVQVYRLGESQPRIVKVTRQAQADMVKMFPPCKAAKHDEVICKRTEKDPEFNISGVGWSNGSTSIRLFAEVPCSSAYGGIMCQVAGYEVQVSDGRILHKLSPHEIKTEWQKSMAWRVNIPDPPEYE
jgi:hypothetical protein